MNGKTCILVTAADPVWMWLYLTDKIYGLYVWYHKTEIDICRYLYMTWLIHVTYCMCETDQVNVQVCVGSEKMLMIKLSPASSLASLSSPFHLCDMFNLFGVSYQVCLLFVSVTGKVCPVLAHG